MKIINICSPHPNAWGRQFPNGDPQWGDWRFVFNENQSEYDYLVAFDDLHAPIQLRCPAKNTIHLATEPPTVHHYDANFLKQFATVITQDRSVDHPGRIFSQPGLTWFLGWHPGNISAQTLNFEELNHLFDEPKPRLLSVIASNKAFTPEHAKRLDFALKLKEHFQEEIDFFGRGFVQMDDKLEALHGYRFNIVLENASIDHYFSEKITDCFIAGAHPIYYGCPNLESYFPKNSFTRIDINDLESSISTIKHAIANHYDQLYRADTKQARDLAMHEHNLYPMLIRIINEIEEGKYGPRSTPTTYGKEILPFQHEKFIKIFKKETPASLREQLSKFAATNWLGQTLIKNISKMRGNI